MSKAVEKIKKLLALSGSPDENEAAAALAQAMHLAAESGIDLDEVRGIEYDQEIGEGKYGVPKARINGWENLLVCKIADIFGCRAFIMIFWDREAGRVRQQFHLVGTAKDREIADYVIAYLQRSLMALARRNMKALTKHRKISESRLRESFLIGAVVRVTELARRIFASQADQAVSNGFALMRQRGALAQRHMEANHNLRDHGKSRAKLDDRAARFGYNAAGEIMIHKGMPGSNAGLLEG